MSLAGYKVTGNRVLITRYHPEKRSSGGLILADENTAQPEQGQVVAVGPGKRCEKTGTLVPVDLAVDDRVVYERGAGIPLKFDGHDLLLLEENQVIGVVEGWLPLT